MICLHLAAGVNAVAAFVEILPQQSLGLLVGAAGLTESDKMGSEIWQVCLRAN